MTAQIPTTVSLNANCVHRRRVKCGLVEFFFPPNNLIIFLRIHWLSHSTERKGNNVSNVSFSIFPAMCNLCFIVE